MTDKHMQPFENLSFCNITCNDTGHESAVNDCHTTDILTTEENNINNFINWLWKIIPPIMFCFGLVGNFLTLCVTWRLGLKRPTLVFVWFLAVTDSVVLLTGLPSNWIVATFDLDIKTLSNVGCKFYYFFIYTSMQYSSWILVGVTVERIAKTYFPFKYRRLYTSKKVAIGLFITLFILILVNFHFFFTNGINEFTEGECGSLTPTFYNFDEYVFVYIDLALLSVGPFAIMFVCNVFLIRMLRQIQRDRVSMMHEKYFKRTNRVSIKMTRMIIVCIGYFLISTAPVSIYYIVDTYLTPGYEETGNCVAVARMELAWSLTYVIQFTNYSVNFYLYNALNYSFSNEVKRLLGCKPRLRRFTHHASSSIRRGNDSSTTGLE